MPLIIMCGFPCSGKSTKAKKLRKELKKSVSKSVVLVVDEDVSLYHDRNDVFSDSNNEKEFNALMKNQVQREISNKKIVIVDALNYVGGIRYELSCIAKDANTPMCVVYCNTPLDDCLQWNGQRPQEKRYSDEVFNALVERFEVPDFNKRWESSLVIAFKDEDVPLAEIKHAIYGSELPTPNLSTQAQPLSSENFVNMVSKQTKDAVDAIITAQKGIRCGSHIYIQGSNHPILMSKRRTPAELTHIRRNFLTYAKIRPPSNDNMITLFVKYINKWE